jgi:hypothetical protein
MAQGVFSTLQRETEQQRRTNEALVRASSGHFETFARGYERTLADLEARLQQAHTQCAELRAKNAELERDNAQLRVEVDKLANQKLSEIAEQERANDRHIFARQQLDLLTPLVLGKVFKMPLTKSSLGTVALQRLLAQLSPEQVHAMLAPLQPAQAAVIAQIFNERIENSEGASSGGAAAARASPNAESAPDPSIAKLLATLDPQKLAEFLREASAWSEQQKNAAPDQAEAPSEPSA